MFLFALVFEGLKMMKSLFLVST